MNCRTRSRRKHGSKTAAAVSELRRTPCCRSSQPTNTAQCLALTSTRPNVDLGLGSGWLGLEVGNAPGLMQWKQGRKDEIGLPSPQAPFHHFHFSRTVFSGSLSCPSPPCPWSSPPQRPPTRAEPACDCAPSFELMGSFCWCWCWRSTPRHTATTATCHLKDDRTWRVLPVAQRASPLQRALVIYSGSRHRL